MIQRHLFHPFSSPNQLVVLVRVMAQVQGDLQFDMESFLAEIDPPQWRAQDNIRLGREKTGLAKTDAVLHGHF